MSMDVTEYFTQFVKNLEFVLDQSLSLNNAMLASFKAEELYGSAFIAPAAIAGHRNRIAVEAAVAFMVTAHALSFEEQNTQGTLAASSDLRANYEAHKKICDFVDFVAKKYESTGESEVFMKAYLAALPK